jgi:hypothetical protein
MVKNHKVPGLNCAEDPKGRERGEKRRERREGEKGREGEKRGGRAAHIIQHLPILLVVERGERGEGWERGRKGEGRERERRGGEESSSCLSLEGR